VFVFAVDAVVVIFVDDVVFSSCGVWFGAVVNNRNVTIVNPDLT